MENLIAPLLVAASAAIGGYVALRKWRPDAIKAYAEATATLAKDNDTIRALLRACRESDERRADQVEDLRDEVAALRRINADNVARIAHLERGYAPALLSRLLDEADAHALEAVLDKVETPVTFSVSDGGGTFRLVNRSFAESLGRTKEEIIALGWRRLIHEPDLRRAEKTESKAWTGSLDGVVLRYHHKDGSLVTFRWFTTPYINGRCLAVARDETDWLTDREEP